MGLFSPEMVVLFECCRSPEDTGLEAGLAEALSRSELDWFRFFDLAVLHKVLPVVYHTLQKGHAGVVPADAWEELSKANRANAMKSLRLANEQRSLSVLLSAKGLRGVFLKGISLAKRLYGDIGGRHAGDLDLLVEPDSLYDIHRALRECGYELKGDTDFFERPAAVKGVARFYPDKPYVHKQKRIHLECHWRFFGNKYLLPVPWDRVWTPSEGGYGLDPELELLYLLVHGSKHRWCRLKWLVDIDRMCRTRDQELWPRFFDLVRKERLERPVAQGLELARLTLGTPVPELPTSPGKVRRLVREPISVLRESDGERRLVSVLPAGVPFAYYTVSLKRDLRFKVGTLAFALFALEPNREVLILPDSLFFLYYPLAPFIWMYRKVARRRALHGRGAA